MNRRQRTRLSFFLMMAGLALLLSFQLLWLHTNYEDEKERLKVQVDDLFSQSIRQIHDSLAEKFYEGSIVIRIKETDNPKQIDSLFTVTENVSNLIFQDLNKSSGISLRRFGNTSAQLPIPPNSIERITVEKGFINLSKDSLSKVDLSQKGNYTFKIQSKKKIPSLSEKHSFAFFLDGQDIHSHLDSLSKVTKQLLSQYIDKNAQTLAFAPNYKMICSGDSLSIASIKEFRSHFYDDLNTPYSYALLIPDHRLYLLREILPQILFSLLLFTSISAAFALIYFNLKQQERLTLIKNDFISNVTHELKTPITTVSVAIEALQTFNALADPRRTEEYLSISQQELRRLSILVDRVLKMSLFDRKQPELKIEAIDLQTLVQSILDSMKLQFEKLSAQVKFQVEHAHYELQGDRVHLTSVIYNLIDNALKYSPQDPQIEIGLSSQAENLQLSVADKGIGIAAEHQNKIFDKFFRVPQGNQHNIKGYGLGLSYVAGVIGQHKGQINVQSQLGQGTRFTLTLPKAHV